MKKIIFFSKNMHIGGMEKALLTLLNNLYLEYEITLVLEEKHGILLNELNKKIIIKEYKISKNKNIILRKCINFSKRLIWRLFNYNRYDFSCCYATYSIIGSKLALLSAKNNVLYVHSNYYDAFNGNKNKITNFFSNLSINKFAHIIFVSNESKEKISSVYPNEAHKFITINNLIDYENIIKLSKEKELDIELFNNSNINFLFIGRLDNTSKNINLLLKSFSIAIEKKASLRLFIIGNGPDKNKLLTKAQHLNINNKVIFLGEKINPYPYIKRSHCIILTSKYEGFPVIYNEALVLNKSVLTTVNSSDDEINSEEYFKIMKSQKNEIAQNIINFNPEDKNYKINYSSINEIRIKKIKLIMEDN